MAELRVTDLRQHIDAILARLEWLEAENARLQRRVEEYQAMETRREWIHVTAADVDGYRVIGDE